MMKRYLLFVLCICSIVLHIHGQESYFMCDFEDPEQNAQWSLVNGKKGETILNKWCIGEATSRGGQSAMYMSVDTGKTVSYYNISAYVTSYIDVKLKEGTYDLSFDWCAMGNIATNSLDGLYVCWAPKYVDGKELKFNSNTVSDLSSDIEQFAVRVDEGGDRRLRGTMTWKNCMTTIKSWSDTTTYRLVFVWLTGGLEVVNPGPSIDNIMIIDADACPAPTGLSVSDDGNLVYLNWVGEVGTYEVKYYSYSQNLWSTPQMVYDTTAVALHGVPEGVCDFYVTAVCDNGDLSTPLVWSEYFLYKPSNRCIDYLTLNKTNCFIANEPAKGAGIIDKLTWTNKLVNEGYTSMASRHTIHFSQTETDPRTCGGLRTVPEGELASVRLGNWDKNSEAERVEYKFQVDAKTNPVLLLKYAVVLEKPADSCTPNPGFLLRVLDEKGDLVSDCASADFDFKKAAEADWEICDRDYATGNLTEVRWKDWTTVGVNLADFDGQTLTIQLTTYDCGGGGHYGYAYFTLGCSDGQLSGMSCGVENTKFTAPDGFVYQWYMQDNPDSILGHTQELEVLPNDTNHYVVDMMFAQDSSCYFSLVASAQPFQPRAEATMSHHIADCKHILQFTNLCHVIETNQLTGTVAHTNKDVDWIEWVMEDGRIYHDDTLRLELDRDGGPIDLKLVAHLKTCVDTLYIRDTIPAIETEYDTLKVNICEGTAYEYSYMADDGLKVDTALTETGVYTFSMPSLRTGCDSIVTIELYAVDTLWTYIDTLIMKGESVMAGNQTFSQTGSYSIPLRSEAGCDSVVVLDLIVYEKLMVEGLQDYTVCHGEPSFLFEYKVTQGRTQLYSLNFSDPLFAPSQEDTLEFENTIDIAIPDEAIPNTYLGEVSFVDTISGNVVIPFALHILYNEDVVTQRWNDVLAVRNSDYNGGFDFVKYQWYKRSAGDADYVALVGDTLSYLHQPLDPSATYSVGLVRQGDSIEIRTCDVSPEDYAAVPVVPTLVEKSQPMPIMARGYTVAQWIMFNGNTLSTQYIVDGVGVVAPNQSGLFLLTLIDNTGQQLQQTILVR